MKAVTQNDAVKNLGIGILLQAANDATSRKLPPQTRLEAAVWLLLDSEFLMEALGMDNISPARFIVGSRYKQPMIKKKLTLFTGGAV